MHWADEGCIGLQVTPVGPCFCDRVSCSMQFQGEGPETKNPRDAAVAASGQLSSSKVLKGTQKPSILPYAPRGKPPKSNLSPFQGSLMLRF